MLFLTLTFKNIKNNKLSSIISIFMLFLVIIFSTLLNSIYENIKKNIINQEIWKEKNKIVIKEKNKTFFNKLLNWNNDLVKISNDFKNNKNIKKYYIIYKFKIPVSANIKFMWMNFTTDTLVFASSNLDYSWWNNINIWINSTLINLYNSQVSDGSFFPKFTLDTLKNLQINLIFWKSSFVNYKKNISYNGNISKIDESYPILWLTIPYKLAEKVKNKIWWKIKIYNIIAYVKNNQEIFYLKNKYKNLKITSYNDKLLQIENKLKIIKITINIIKYIIYILLVGFIIFLATNLILTNKNTLKVLYYHGANIFQQFLLIFYTISFYLIFASLSAFWIIYYINWKIPNINQQIENNWYIWLEIQKISYKNFLILISILFISINLISFWIFVKNNK